MIGSKKVKKTKIGNADHASSKFEEKALAGEMHFEHASDLFFLIQGSTFTRDIVRRNFASVEPEGK